MQQQDSSDPTGVSVNTPRPSPTAYRARERKANAALQMKIAGATWQEVAEIIGYPTARQAIVAVERALERELKTDDRAKLRSLAGQRLERLLRGVWAKAIDPDHPEHLAALARAREIIDRHAKLYGLDAPTEFVVHSPTMSELEAWVSKVTSGLVPPVEEADIFDIEVIDDDDPDGGVPALTG